MQDEDVFPVTIDTGVALNGREKKFCTLLAQGHPPKYVAKNLGLSLNQVTEWLQKPEIARVLAVLREEADRFLGIEVTRDLLNSMLLEAHATSANSMEKVASIRELGKMNGMYDPTRIVVEGDNRVADKISQLEGLSDEELMRRADMRIALKNAEDAEIVDDGLEQQA